MLIGGLALMFTAAVLPREWYDRLPRDPTLPLPPISGIALLRMSIVAEGLVLLWLSRRPRVLEMASEARPITLPAAREGNETISRRTSLALLGAITLAGLALRVWRLDSDLWLDEIAPVIIYRDKSVLEVIATYLASSNHLLNTLLVKLSVAVFGEHEWSIRLPAAAFGTATIPVLYWTARLVFTRLNSLAAALLLAVSYHHIFFSQNARGYIGYVFFSLLASGLLCKALADGRGRTWALYVATMTLNTAALLISAFVLASHVVVGLGAVWMWQRSGHSARVVARTLIAVFAAIAFLSFQLYALVLPQAYVYMRSVYTQAGSGYSLVSTEFATEFLRGLLMGVGARVGWGTLPLVLLALGLGGLGFLRLVQRHWVLTASLMLPGVLTAGAVLLGGLTVSPRFFLLSLPLAILVSVEVMHAVVRAIWARVPPGRRRPAMPSWLPLALFAVVAGLLLVPLFGYYEVPKQSYVASAEYLRGARGPDDLVVVVHLAETGFRYYGPRFGFEEDKSCTYLRSKAALDAVVRSHRSGRVLLVTTFPRAMRLEFPDLAASIEHGWTIARVFRGTVGDGDVIVWTPR